MIPGHSLDITATTSSAEPAADNTEAPLIDLRIDSDGLGPLTVHIPPDTTAPALARTLIDCRTQIAQHGARLAAFLSLPDVDATGIDLATQCDTFFIGEFTDTDEVVSELTEIADWQNALDRFAEERGLTGLVRLDTAAIAEQAAMTWDIVEMGGRLYVFDK